MLNRVRKKKKNLKFKIIFGTKCKIFDSTNNTVLTTINNNELYTFPVAKSNENARYAYSSKVVDSSNT